MRDCQIDLVAVGFEDRRQEQPHARKDSTCKGLLLIVILLCATLFCSIGSMIGDRPELLRGLQTETGIEESADADTNAYDYPVMNNQPPTSSVENRRKATGMMYPYLTMQTRNRNRNRNRNRAQRHRRVLEKPRLNLVVRGSQEEKDRAEERFWTESSTEGGTDDGGPGRLVIFGGEITGPGIARATTASSIPSSFANPTTLPPARARAYPTIIQSGAAETPTKLTRGVALLSQTATGGLEKSLSRPRQQNGGNGRPPRPDDAQVQSESLGTTSPSPSRAPSRAPSSSSSFWSSSSSSPSWRSSLMPTNYPTTSGEAIESDGSSNVFIRPAATGSKNTRPAKFTTSSSSWSQANDVTSSPTPALTGSIAPSQTENPSQSAVARPSIDQTLSPTSEPTQEPTSEQKLSMKHMEENPSKKIGREIATSESDLSLSQGKYVMDLLETWLSTSSNPQADLASLQHLFAKLTPAPTASPSGAPSTHAPSDSPITLTPTSGPVTNPTWMPTAMPTWQQTELPTAVGTTWMPTTGPTAGTAADLDQTVIPSTETSIENMEQTTDSTVDQTTLESQSVTILGEGASPNPTNDLRPNVLQASSNPASEQLLVSTAAPTDYSSDDPSSDHSSGPPSLGQSDGPTQVTASEANVISVTQSPSPSLGPSSAPSLGPSPAPSLGPSPAPSLGPSSRPSLGPSSAPSLILSSEPSLETSSAPSLIPSSAPSLGPSSTPSLGPSSAPSFTPSISPSLGPSSALSFTPSISPTPAPTMPSKLEAFLLLVQQAIDPSPQPTPLLSSAPSASSDATSQEPSFYSSPSESPSVESSLGSSAGTSSSSLPSTGPSQGPSPSPTIIPTAAPVQPSDVQQAYMQMFHHETSVPTSSPSKSSIPSSPPSESSAPTAPQNQSPTPSLEPSGSASLPANHVELVGNNGEPATAFPLAHCQGDCDQDGDCAGNLTCWQRNSNDFVPGCVGGETHNKDTDFCVLPEDLLPLLMATPLTAVVESVSSHNQTANQVERIGNNGAPASAFPLPHCKGDCDYDEDCAGNLTCWQRNANETVPGCLGGETFNEATDICVLPEDALASQESFSPQSLQDDLVERIGNDGKPASVFPLPRCKGDCDYDDECSGDLICWQRNANDYVPGCVGGETLNDGTDVCVLPEDTPTQTPTSSPGTPS
ncbi:expressed unknown protein [Seminavis robusta]|uniref:Uncharacterized protein n=1 Tax=Seminavis robusta TaxID=568900 RepID=A0A9N8GZB4_9STRA|nr:expressed unknown protein [Seminavis robusta]|eukprot:Sro2_g001100.1 n/a (1167) ;mRNA; r:12253-16011